MKKTILAVLFVATFVNAINQGAWQNGGIDQGAWQNGTASCTPPTLSYAADGQIDTVGVSGAMTATVGETPDSIAAIDALPAGLSVVKTGVGIGNITGTPTTATAEAAYTIRAYKDGCSNVDVELTLTVVYGIVYLTSVDPGTGYSGQAITLTGRGFGATQGASTVAMGDSTPAVTSWSNTEIVFTCPNFPTADTFDFIVSDGTADTIESGFIYMLHIYSNIVVSADGGGSTVPTGAQLTECLTNLSIEAVNAAGHPFTAWTHSANVVVANEADLTTTCATSDSAAGTVTANFDTTRYTLTMTLGTGGAAITPPAGANTVDSGAVSNISSTAQSTYQFKEWTVSGGATLGSAASVNANTVTLAADGGATATFDTVPGLASLVSPESDSILLDTFTTLKWTHGVHTDSVHFQFSTVTNFSTTVYEDTVDIAADSADVYGLVSSTIYFWRVRGVNVNGVSAWSQTTNFRSYHLPVIDSIVPDSAKAGDPVTVYGSHFVQSTGAQWVSGCGIGGKTADVYPAWSADTFQFVVPCTTSGTYDLIVAIVDSTTEDEAQPVGTDTISITLICGTIAVDSINPDSGASSILDTINGSGYGCLQGAGYVLYGSDSAGIASWADTRIIDTIPALTGPDTVKVYVYNNSGECDSSKTYIISEIDLIDSVLQTMADSIILDYAHFMSGYILNKPVRCNYAYISSTDSIKCSVPIYVRDSLVYDSNCKIGALSGSAIYPFIYPPNILTIKLNGKLNTPPVTKKNLGYKSKIQWR